MTIVPRRWGLFIYLFFYLLYISEKTYNAGRYSENYLMNEFERQENIEIV